MGLPEYCHQITFPLVTSIVFRSASAGLFISGVTVVFYILLTFLYLIFDESILSKYKSPSYKSCF